VASEPVRVQQTIRFGEDFELDIRAYELRRAGRVLKLPPIPMDVLIFLVEERDRLVSREQIVERVWGHGVFLDTDNSINGAIRKIRQALRDDSDQPRFIQTFAGRGYRFIAPVIETGSEAEPAALSLFPGAENLIGKKISHYRVLQLLGGGGMGVVFKAEDLKLGRQVAMKFLPGELASDPVAFERLQREARAASALDHPKICSIYELGEHEGQPFIVMQLLEGRTLREWVEIAPKGSAQSQLDQVLNFAIQILDGLDAAHQKGIIHRDIKPANIFITTRGEAKILDFGVAKIVDPGILPSRTIGSSSTDVVQEDTVEHKSGQESSDQQDRAKERLIIPLPNANLTRTGVSMGTPAYLSPEQVRHQELDTRTDIFSFGLVLYEMATGQRAFAGDTESIIREAVLNQSPVPARQRNPELPPDLERIIGKLIEKDRCVRYQSASEIRSDLYRLKHAVEIDARSAVIASTPPVSRISRRILLAVAAAMVIAGLIGGMLYRRSQPAKRLTDRDSVVLGDFTNTTGDAVFDDTLKQGLSVQLEQSPFLELISERRVNQILKLMGRPAGDHLTPEVAREVCLRAGSKAMLNGSIAEIGNQYIIGLKAVNCDTGDVLAEAQEQAVDKGGVLKALDAAAISMRSELGESLSSVQKYATPLMEATTPSLEALKAYSLGEKVVITEGWTAALPFQKRAVELDPNFAMPYAAMATAYSNVNEVGLAAKYASKAYQEREKVSERERFEIETDYEGLVTGDLEKASEASEMWHQTYPRDRMPYVYMPFFSTTLGNHEKALEQAREALRLEPDRADSYANAGNCYANLNRLDEAEGVYKRAEQGKVEDETLLDNRYLLAFLKGDAALMGQLAAVAAGRSGTEDLLLASQANTQAWFGKLKNARQLTQAAVASAQRNNAKETAALYQAAAALREVESGNPQQARADVDAAMKLAPNRDIRSITALVLAREGDTAGAEKLAAELNKTFPLDTLVQRYWLPTIRAAVALEQREPKRAIELLKTASSIELGQPATFTIYLCPVYLRGEAYLMLGDGEAAAAEFQKFIDHRGLVGNFQWGALARLGLARAYAKQGDMGKARDAYQAFLTIWTDADPDVPVLERAKVELANLR
jgi:serine/threonine protein kinase/tetratricopeptide (TPR) repeat protein